MQNFFTDPFSVLLFGIAFSESSLPPDVKNATIALIHCIQSTGNQFSSIDFCRSTMQWLLERDNCHIDSDGEVPEKSGIIVIASGSDGLADAFEARTQKRKEMNHTCKWGANKNL